MKIYTSVFLVAICAIAIKAQNVDPDTQEQINAAKKQAEKMGVKMPDIDKMMQEDAADDAAAKKETGKQGCGHKTRTTGKFTRVDSAAGGISSSCRQWQALDRQ